MLRFFWKFVHFFVLLRWNTLPKFSSVSSVFDWRFWKSSLNWTSVHRRKKKKSGDVTSRKHSIVMFLRKDSHSQNYFNFELDAGCRCCGRLYGGFSLLLGFLYSVVKDNNILYYLFYFILLYLLGEFGFGNIYICFFRRLPTKLSCTYVESINIVLQCRHCIWDMT